jgi:hypothetical protein
VTLLFGLVKEAVLKAQQQQRRASTSSRRSWTESDATRPRPRASSSSSRRRPCRLICPAPNDVALVQPLGAHVHHVCDDNDEHAQLQIPAGLQLLGGGPEQASIAAFMAENKLNTLPGASSTSSSLPPHILQSNIR